MVMDKVAHKLDLDFAPGTYRSLSASGRHAGRKFVLLKPLTFVNLSGEAARLAVNKHGIDPKAEFLVVTDDADLETGQIKFTTGGGTASHNGLESISAAVGPHFAKLRVGIGRSGGRLRDHVLSPFTNVEAEVMDVTTDTACEAVLNWMAKGLSFCQNNYNRKPVSNSNEPPQERS